MRFEQSFEKARTEAEKLNYSRHQFNSNTLSRFEVAVSCVKKEAN